MNPMPNMRLHPRPTTLIAVLISMVTGIALGIAAHNYRTHRPLENATDLETFGELVRQIRDNYVDPLDESMLLDEAIAGMMKRLDPHSSFLNRDALSDLTEQTTGRFGGIGVELGYSGDRIAVVAPIDDSPAARAGVEAGDVLLELDGKSIADMSMEEVVGQLRGEPGSNVEVSIERPGLSAPVQLNLVRDVVNVASVRSRDLEPGYGYVRISQFQNTTGEELTRAVRALQSQHGPLAGLVLDLRNNPGGVLQASVDVADAFLTEGLIVYTRGRQPSSELRFSASGGDLLDGAPLVVLINRGSASASEIVAGALQDHGRALVLGASSYGKGSVQAVLLLDRNHALKLTTARYFTPNGRSIQSVGIHPDLEVAEQEGEDLVLAEALRQLKRG